ncbi:dermonecrotic toxin domain-containing protein [Pseudomonas paralactis]|uniref:dermonecrotic toxin domain-containing protein n=1 Tax=Pseudomonas paralactis TaxID=1615673 RepID=UPI0034D512CA
MTRVTPPYFFAEFLLPVNRSTLSERERALGLTVKDLEWLHGVYYASDAGRQDSRLQSPPMRVERLLINMAGQTAIPLAGAFVMSPSPDGAKALLYTPYGGIEVFDSHASMLTEVSQALAGGVQREELLSFLSIAQRNSLPAGSVLTLTTSPVLGAVMEDQEQALQACQRANVQAMLEQLQKTPTLSDMLDTLLGIMAHPYFPGLDQRQTRVNCFIQSPTDTDRRWVESLPLREALLQFYIKHAWPLGQTRDFINPKHVTTQFSQPQLEQDREHWETLIEQTSGTLSKLLDSLLQTYWNEDIDNGTSRLELFAQVLADKLRLDVLLKRQIDILSADESHMLQALFLSDQGARSAYAADLSVEKVRIYAPYQHYVELASTLMLNQNHAYLYTQSRGLQVLQDLDDLKDTLLSMLTAAGHEDELLNFLSLDERNIFLGLDQINVAARSITGHVFTGMIEDIAAKQISNMNHALGLYRSSAGQVDLEALLDYALDIRTMLDNRLADLDTDGRWTTHPVSSGNGRPSTVQAERAKLQLQSLQAAEQGLRIERIKHPTLRSMAALALNTQLHTRQLDLKADEVFVNTYPSRAEQREERPTVSSLSMVEHFIERLGQEGNPLPVTSRLGFYKQIAPRIALKLNNLPIKTFNDIIEQVLKVFAGHEMRELPRLFLNNTRDKHAHSMLLGLRSEAELRRLIKTLSPGSHAILDAVLRTDSLVRLTRHGLNGFLPDAYSLSLQRGTSDALLPLANLFVLTERGGLDPRHSGQAILWTPRRSHEVFPSISALRESLVQRLAHPIKRLTLLENLRLSQRVPHQEYRLGPLQRIDDNLLDNRLTSYGENVMDAVDHLLEMDLPARAVQDRLDAILETPAPTNLARASALAEAMITQQTLPVWLAMAPSEEQIYHAELLEQYQNSAPDEEDYLHGIPTIREHTFSELLRLLQARYPKQAISPDDVLIPTHQALDIHEYNLTDFALRHWPDLNSQIIRPRSRTATPLPDSLDASAVIQMVRQLDLQSAYQKRLHAELGTDTEAAAKRRRLFCQQLPWQVLHYAHEQHLQERLSTQGLSLVQQAFDMPDALARAALAGASTLIRPVELVATAGATAAKVLGMYLINAQDKEDGTVVLYAPYSEQHVLKQYDSEQALLDELERPGALQDWVIAHLEDPHQAVYRNLLQNNRHRPSEIRLASSAITGNLLHYLFSENTLILLRMLACQFEEGAKLLWDKAVGLFGTGIPTAVQFMAGKLAYPLVVWRCYTLIKRSMEALQLHQWKAAMKVFILAVAQMAALYSELDGSEPPPPDEADIVDWPEGKLPTAIIPALRDVTAPSRTRLQPFEGNDIALKDLELDTVTHVYKDKKRGKDYVPLAGKVYSIKKTSEHWRLENDDTPGPYIGRNSEGNWVLDLSVHQPRFGQTWTRQKTQRAERHEINIEARGIRAIAALASWKAQAIDEALNVAIYYAVTCKRNIEYFAKLLTPDSRVGLFLCDLFGTSNMNPGQVQKIENILDGILDELSDPSLIGPDSMRFISGRSLTDANNEYAMILVGDSERKVYLFERFFDPDLTDYIDRLSTPFDMYAHARASTLIHELTHLRFKTEDIAYLRSMEPFRDLIDTAKPGAQAVRTRQDDLQTTALSTLTPDRMLFKTWDDVAKTWQDYGFFKTTHYLKRKVLDVTGARDLAEARQIFMSNTDKRIDVILSNADSVTYLITHLGRLLDEGA